MKNAEGKMVWFTWKTRHLKATDYLFVVLSVLSLCLVGFSGAQSAASETHLKNLRQLTFGGENAEAYFSFDNAKLIFQSTREDWPCDQIYIMNTDGSGARRVSTGKGRTTCAYWLKDGKHFLYSSTHAGAEDCPPKPDYSRGYVWGIYKDYDIFLSDLQGNLTRLTQTPGYDAEATVSPDGKKIVFTSVRDGDLELYSMNVDGTGVRRLTHEIGYDGGAFFSPDSRRIVYRASHPADEKSQTRYQELLGQNLVAPGELELFVMDADGSNSVQITRNKAANFCPFFHPAGKKIIFASNLGDPKGRNFDLYLVNLDGTSLEQVTFNQTFDGFPMFSSDGKKLVFASNRNANRPGETNVFIADWVD
jgi:Tol biopolymer transport system component